MIEWELLEDRILRSIARNKMSWEEADKIIEEMDEKGEIVWR